MTEINLTPFKNVAKLLGMTSAQLRSAVSESEDLARAGYASMMPQPLRIPCKIGKRDSYRAYYTAEQVSTLLANRKVFIRYGGREIEQVPDHELLEGITKGLSFAEVQQCAKTALDLLPKELWLTYDGENGMFGAGESGSKILIGVATIAIGLALKDIALVSAGKEKIANSYWELEKHDTEIKKVRSKEWGLLKGDC